LRVPRVPRVHRVGAGRVRERRPRRVAVPRDRALALEAHPARPRHPLARRLVLQGEAAHGMIETRYLTKQYRDLLALDKLTLTVEKGDIYGFIGPNGAGKTTTMKILATLLRPTSGQAYVCGYSVNGQAKHIRKKIGYVPDFFGVYEDMTVAEYLEFFGALYGIHGQERQRVIRDVLDLTDLSYKEKAQVESLSRGMQ